MNTVQFPIAKLIEVQASSWVASIDAGMNSSQETELDKWLAESQLHGEALVRVASMWDMLDVLKPIAKLIPIETIDSSRGINSSSKQFAIAACLALFTVALLFNTELLSIISESARIQTTQNSDQKTISTLSYVTAVGERSNITLDDGSEIKLNTDSKITVLFTKHERKLELSKGEAFFEVVKNPERPFIVLTAKNRVTAVGTAFSVDVSDAQDTEVLVTEGRVKVDRLLRNPLHNNLIAVNETSSDLAVTAPPVFLSQGQKVMLNSDNAELSYVKDLDSALAWREGMIVFNGEPLAQAIHEIDRYIPLDFKIIDKEIATIPVGGYFKTGDLDQLLLVLEGNFGVVSERQGDQILLRKSR